MRSDAIWGHYPALHQVGFRAQQVLTSNLKTEKSDDWFLFAEKNHRTHQNKILTFTGRPWLVELYRRQMLGTNIIRKPTQIGVSELLLSLCFFLCQRGQAGLYVMPTETGMFTFVSNRVDKCIISSPLYRTLVNEAGGSKSTSLKHIGLGGLKFVGSNAKAGFAEYPATFVVIDEYDFCNHENIGLAQDRLKSTFKTEEPRQIFNGTPTLPDWGIDKEIQASRYEEWMVQCPACKGWQVLDWFTNIMETVAGHYQLIDRDWRESYTRDIAVYCSSCGEPWDEEKRAQAILAGRYEARNPSLPRHGVALSRMHDLYVRPREMYLGTTDRKGFRDAIGDPTAEMRFHNNDLGVAYHPQGSGIDRVMLLKCREDGYMLPTRLGPYAAGRNYSGFVTAGVDVGKARLYVRISWYPDGRRRMAYVGTVREFEDLEALFTRFSVSCAVIDLNPETRKVNDLIAELRYVYACEFVRTEESTNTKDIAVDRSKHLVKLQRTMIFDRLLQEYELGRSVMPQNIDTIESGRYVKHMGTPIRYEKEKKGRRYFLWKERDSGKDDFFLAEVYDLVAFLINPQPRITSLYENGHPPVDPWSSHAKDLL